MHSLADSQLLAQRGSAIAGPLERAVQSVIAAPEYAGWLPTVPVSHLFLKDRKALSTAPSMCSRDEAFTGDERLAVLSNGR